jgi:cytochrome bd ubiquinol oxidase subunit II
VAVTLVFQKKRLGLAFFMAALQYFFAFFGYGLSHLPYLIYPYLKLKSVTGLNGVDASILIAVVMGIALLLPSVILVLRLVIFNSDKKREEL